MKFLNLVSMTMNLLEGSHIIRLMQDTLIETFKTVIGITQIYKTVIFYIIELHLS